MGLVDFDEAIVRIDFGHFVVTTAEQDQALGGVPRGVVKVCDGSEAGKLACFTVDQHSPISVRLEVHDSRPSDLEIEQWPDIAEVSIESWGEAAKIFHWEEFETPVVEVPIDEGSFRARYAVAGADVQFDVAPSDTSGVRSYLIQLWPEKPRHARVVAQTSQWAQNTNRHVGRDEQFEIMLAALPLDEQIAAAIDSPLSHDLTREALIGNDNLASIIAGNLALRLKGRFSQEQVFAALVRARDELTS